MDERLPGGEVEDRFRLPSEQLADPVRELHRRAVAELAADHRVDPLDQLAEAPFAHAELPRLLLDPLLEEGLRCSRLALGLADQGDVGGGTEDPDGPAGLVEDHDHRRVGTLL